MLGNREDNNEFKPYLVHPKMYEELNVIMLGQGTQHVVALTSDGDSKAVPAFDFSKFVKVQSEFPDTSASDSQKGDEADKPDAVASPEPK